MCCIQTANFSTDIINKWLTGLMANINLFSYKSIINMDAIIVGRQLLEVIIVILHEL